MQTYFIICKHFVVLCPRGLSEAVEDHVHTSANVERCTADRRWHVRRRAATGPELVISGPAGLRVEVRVQPHCAVLPSHEVVLSARRSSR